MAGISQYATELACKIVREQFGDAPERVVRTLLRVGIQPLRDIMRDTCSPQLPPAAVKQALLVLIQHNCVAVFLEGPDPNSKAPRSHLYQAQLDAIVQNIRKAKFLLHVKGEFGQQEGEEEKGVLAEAILEELLRHGRLRLDQVTAAVAGRTGKAGDGEHASRVRNMFMSMVHSHYLERAPLATAAPPVVRPHPSSTKRAKQPKPGSKEWAEEQAAAAKRADEQLYQSSRFKLPAESLLENLFSSDDDDDNMDDDNNAAATEGDRQGAGGRGRRGEGGVGRGGGAAGGGRKRRRLVVDEDDEEKPALKRQSVDGGAARAGGQVKAPVSVLWRVNAEEFNRRFRHAMCAAMVADKIDRDAGAVVATMMAMGRSSENSVKEVDTMPLSEDDVTQQVAKAVASGRLVPLEQEVTAVLKVLANDSLELVSYVSEGPGGSLYTVNMERIMQNIRLKQLEAVVCNRFGVAGLRIFRLLILDGQLEQKQIADLGMMPQKDTRELLYRMLKGGFLALQDIPKTSDHAPSRTFYTWSADMDAASQSLAVDLYRATANIRTRLEHEMAKERELLDIIEAAKVSRTIAHQLTAAQKQRLQRLQQVSQVMEGKLLQLDDMLSIINDF